MRKAYAKWDIQYPGLPYADPSTIAGKSERSRLVMSRYKVRVPHGRMGDTFWIMFIGHKVLLPANV